VSLFVSNTESEYYTKFTTVAGEVAYTLTGVVEAQRPVQGESAAWVRERASFSVPVPSLAEDHRLQLVYWAPFVTLASVSKDRTATNAGWAVDGFGLSSPKDLIGEALAVYCDLAVRDADGFVNRLAYNIHLIGREVQVS
jgi:hypothetical protein